MFVWFAFCDGQILFSYQARRKLYGNNVLMCTPYTAHRSCRSANYHGPGRRINLPIRQSRFIYSFPYVSNTFFYLHISHSYPSPGNIRTYLHRHCLCFCQDVRSPIRSKESLRGPWPGKCALTKSSSSQVWATDYSSADCSHHRWL